MNTYKNTTMIKHDSGITSEDISSQYDKETLLMWKQMIDEDIAEMDIQINFAKAQQKSTGEYSDPNWFHSVRTKKKLYGVLSQKIQTQLGIVKERESNAFESRFIDVCCRELDADLFDELKAMARAEINNKPDLKDETYL